ncbi:MAG: bifunctional riboflavin kinase/FAD synthetase [Rhizobiaceae bacterium]
MRKTTASMFEGTKGLPEELGGSVVAIGNFDGVHRGHMAVLGTALELARRSSAPATVLTFEPHPRTWFRPQQPVFRLTPASLKVRKLVETGFDAVIVQAFDESFSAVTANDFITRILASELAASHVVAGHDFHFGKGREGTPQLLAEQGPGAGFAVSLVEPFRTGDGEVVSSTRIRNALSTGDVALANALLGWPWRVSGEVRHGKKLGRTLGFPTANLALPGEVTLRHGIYAVRLYRADGSAHDGVASYGRRPTFDNGEALLETFVLDFSDDLYGEIVEIEFHAFLRGEERFDSAEALVVQMQADTRAARDILSARST